MAFYNSAYARTLVVAKQGAAEYSTIHDAIAASGPGDTIRIGPGRYDDFHPLVAPAWTHDAVAIVDRTNLVIIGAGADSTLVGPATRADTVGASATGFAAIDGGTVEISGVGIENLEFGVYWESNSLTVTQCRISNCGIGAAVFEAVSGARFDRVEFTPVGNQPHGIISTADCQGLVVNDCEFRGSSIDGLGIVALATNGVEVSGCRFSIGTAIQLEGASGAVAGCVADSSTGLAVWATHAASVTLEGSSLYGDLASVFVDGWSVLSGTGNVLSGGERLATVYIASQSQVTLTGNDILKRGRFAAMIGQYFYEIQTNDLTGNFWGTTDTDSIAAWIWDYSDDPITRAHIAYVPFSTSTVPTERGSLGGLKALYLGR